MRRIAQITVGILMPLWSGLAYGACDDALLHKLLDKGFSKAEIMQLCGSAQPTPASPEPPATIEQTENPKQEQTAPAHVETPRAADTPTTTGSETGLLLMMVYHKRLVWNREISDAKLKVDPEAQRIWVEAKIHEDAQGDSESWWESGNELRDFSYDQASHTVIYTAPDRDKQVVCGKRVTRRALIGSWEEVVLNDNCQLEFATQGERETNQRGRQVLRNYGTVTLYVRL
jgi:hypothetical protein